MNIFELLKKDHEKVLGIFEELEEAGEEAVGKQDSKQDRLFSRLRRELEIHMGGEELILYSPLKEEEETRAIVLESYEEHHIVRLLLEEMDKMPKDEYWVAKLSVLKGNFMHHIGREEGDLFEEAQEIINEEAAMSIGKHMAEYKREQIIHT